VRHLPHGARGPRINGRVIRAFRIERGWSKTELGDRASVDPTYVGRLEDGTRTHPAPRITKALADAFGVAITDLLAVELEQV
jgi:transcriptional regulator with XRE-family HTH domain